MMPSSQNRIGSKGKYILFIVIVVFVLYVALESTTMTRSVVSHTQGVKPPVQKFADSSAQTKQGLHVFREKEPVSSDDIFPYINYSHFGMDWISIIKEFEWSYSNLNRGDTVKKELNPFEAEIDSFGLTSLSKSKLSLVQDNAFRKGDYIQVIMEAYDEYGNRRLRGGDFLQGLMTNEKLGTRTGGRVFDYGNGTYSIYFYAAWKGDATIAIHLVRHREAILYQTFLNTFENKRLGFQAKFTNGELAEIRDCTITNGLGIWKDKCGFVSPSSLGKTAFICEKPEKLSCEDLKSTTHNLGDMVINTARDTEGMSYLFEGEKQKSAIGNPIKIKIKDSNVTPKPPTCGPDLPVPLSSGYWKDNLTFVPLMCRSQQWQKEDMEKCLLGKEVYMYGDSTVGQIESCLRALNVLPSELLQRQYLFLRGGSPIQYVEGMFFEGDYIDRIRNCTAVTPVVVMNFCFHFGSWTTRTYLDRIFGAKYAILRLFKRCPESIVMIKLAHPRDNADSVQKVHSSNYRFHDMNRMIRRVFGGIGVSFLDIWDLVSSHISENQVHMPGPVIMQELHLMLSYICPEMVKKLSY
ncbi:NXPE family member 3-like [Glandiceps talaboti]